MQYSDTVTLNGLVQSCEMWAGLGNTGITGDPTTFAIFNRLLNTNYDKVVSMILESEDEITFDDPNLGNSGYIFSKNLVGGTRVTTLALSDKILKMKRVEVSYDGVNYVKAEPLDMGQLSTSLQDPNVDQFFNVKEPKYMQFGFDIYLFPMPATSVTGGLKIYATRQVDHFTVADTTQEPGIPQLFHDMIPIGASLDYCIGHRKEASPDLAQRFIDFEVRLRKFVGTANEDRHAVLVPSNQQYE